MHAVIVGLGSDIGREIAYRLQRDGWKVSGTARSYAMWHTADDTEVPTIRLCDLTDRAQVDEAVDMLREPWDLLLFAAGTYEPLGAFMQCDEHEWERCLTVNALAPLRMLRRMYPLRRIGASVAFFAGPNPNRANPTYSAYMAGKVILHKAVEDIQAECDAAGDDLRLFILGPGLTRTKMLNETIRAGTRAGWYERVKAFLASGEQGTSFDDIYAMLRKCMEGTWAKGRNIHVKDNWRMMPQRDGMPARWADDTFKLRRVEHSEARTGAQ